MDEGRGARISREKLNPVSDSGRSFFLPRVECLFSDG